MDGLLSWTIIPAAFALDMLLGDPRCFPHPVRWMGWAIGAAEPRFRRLVSHPAAAGVLFAAALVVGAWALTALLVDAMRGVRPALGAGIETLLVYYCLSVRSLDDALGALADHGFTSRVRPARRAAP